MISTQTEILQGMFDTIFNFTPTKFYVKHVYFWRIPNFMISKEFMINNIWLFLKTTATKTKIFQEMFDDNINFKLTVIIYTFWEGIHDF